MDSRRTLVVDAFCSEPLSGNPAGVVPNAEGLTAEQMGNVARELNASETAFILPAEDAVRRLRFFTPTREIDLCGHATVAALSHLFEDGAIEAGTHSIETAAGAIEVDVDPDGTVWMHTEQPTVETVDADLDRIAAALGADPATLRDVGSDLPVAVATAGVSFLVVPLNFLSAVSGLDPDLGAITDLSAEFDVTGLYAFSFDALSPDGTLHARMFAPAAGVEEDPVTGTASAAVGAYLRSVGAFDGDLPEEMVFEQGHFIDRPGTVRVRAQDDPVVVGGEATTALDGELFVPPVDDDGIIEA
ncbi:MAG: PhzF family phenazine biosynthesis protein [Natronomonas sp.]